MRNTVVVLTDFLFPKQVQPMFQLSSRDRLSFKFDKGGLFTIQIVFVSHPADSHEVLTALQLAGNVEILELDRYLCVIGVPSIVFLVPSSFRSSSCPQL